MRKGSCQENMVYKDERKKDVIGSRCMSQYELKNSKKNNGLKEEGEGGNKRLKERVDEVKVLRKGSEAKRMYTKANGIRETWTQKRTKTKESSGEGEGKEALINKEPEN